MNNIINKVKLGGLLLFAGMFAVSCSDWDDHYQASGNDGSNTTIWDEVMSRPELSDFAEVLKAINVTRQHKKTGTTYAEQLQGGHSYTLFAPVNNTFDKKAIIEATQTNSGDSSVEKLYALNHLLPSPYSVGGTAEGKKLLLLNDKYVTFEGNSVNGVKIRESNVHCKNGVLHVLDKPIPYNYNIYEALVNLPEFKEGAGKVLQAYNVQEFDESASIPRGSKDGVTIYADSVFREINKMMNNLTPLKAQDSTYIVAVPSINGWNNMWEKVSAAFSYPLTEEKRDSLQEFYSYRAIMQDAIFSMTTINKNQTDSIVSIRYNKNAWDFDPRFHCYQNPYEEGGVLAGAEQVIDCANGKIYCMPEYSFDPKTTYHTFIEVEGESYSSKKVDPSPYYYSTASTKTPTLTVRTAAGDSISKGAFLEVYNSSNYSVTFRIDNTLAAKYDIKVILLPLSVTGAAGTKLPVKFKAALNYLDENDNQKHELVTTDFTSDPLRVDTITLFKDFKFPVCNYNMSNNNVSLSLETTVGSRETAKYSRRMYIDAIVLTPKED